MVFQAFDSALLRPVAIKFLTPRLAVSPLARARFSREGQAAAAIKHPNVVTIYAIGEHEGLPYLVMEYVNGITLADRLEREGCSSESPSSASASRSPGAWLPPTRRASSTATSSRRTSCSRAGSTG